MKQEYNEYFRGKVLIQGYVHYKEGSPVHGAIVILEKISCEYNEVSQEEQNQTIHMADSVTGNNGEFCFVITDKSSYYKIKVFDNNHR